MGRNLALNLLDHGTPVIGWDQDAALLTQFEREARGQPATTTTSAVALVASLETPRLILLMIPAGQPVDDVLGAILPVLDRDDIVIDGGNTHFEDTRRRAERASQIGIEYVGMGVSGGEAGARFGPAMMVGATTAAWSRMENVFAPIAAAGSAPGFPACIARLGTDGAGHFVKMVHNGIEYADMQFIAECYHLLRASGRTPPELAAVFERFNAGPLESFLIELTAQVLGKADGDGYLVDAILDAAEQKGTGRWTVQTALELGVPVPSIAAAVDARSISSDVAARRLRARRFPPEPRNETVRSIDLETLERALLAAKLAAYAQGQKLIAAGNSAFGWSIDSHTVAAIWTGGCILRARLLRDLSAAEGGDWLMADGLRDHLTDGMAALADIVADASVARLPVPALAATLGWFDASRTARLPHNLTQAQRDAFGAHTYRRLDAPDEPVHSKW